MNSYDEELHSTTSWKSIRISLNAWKELQICKAQTLTFPFNVKEHQRIRMNIRSNLGVPYVDNYQYLD